ncbi:hypothetical protein PINS_up003405 [Pythium insidiosum]|nr:hypothetical protein PINS_up003405 [Pythium insidiosum]
MSSRLAQRYRDLTQLKHQLCRENEALNRLHTERMILGGRLQQILDVDGELPLSKRPFRFRPLSTEEYYQEIMLGREDAVRFLRHRDHVSTGLEICGWTDMRRRDGTHFTFAVQKRLLGVSADFVAQQSWSVVSNPERFRLLYSATLHTRFHILQRINDHACLVYWTTTPEGHGRTHKTIFLLAMVPVEDGFMLLLQGIDRRRVAFEEDGINDILEEARQAQTTRRCSEPPLAERWCGVNNWSLYRQVGPNECLVQFGGASVLAELWLLEVLLIAIRWEHAVLGRHLL